MENIFLFIIIMIVMSLVSKNKKKKASQTFSEKTKTTYFDQKGQQASSSANPMPVKDLKDLLNSFKNFDPQSSGAKNIIKNTVESAATDSEEVNGKSQNFQERFSFKEQNSEAYSFNESKKSYDPTAKSYNDIPVYEDKSKNYQENSATKKRAESKIDQFDMLLKKEKKTVFKQKYFDSKLKLKNAIIVSEVLKSKYV